MGPAKQQLPGLLVGDVYPGGYDELYVSHIFNNPHFFLINEPD